MARSTRGVDYQDVPRPVSALADDYPSGHHDPRHSHRRAQLLYGATGVMVVTTDAASFVIPPQRAVFIPAAVEHEVRCRGAVSCRTLYFDTVELSGLPDACRVIEVGDLLRELLLEACRLPVEYDEAGRDGRIMELVVDEVRHARTVPLHVPMPAGERLVKIAVGVLAEPASRASLSEHARSAAMGRRTFTRAFRRETGMSFAAWRAQVRLMEAVSLLAVGGSVGAISWEVGYDSASAFTAAFRRAFGLAPTRWMAQG